MCPSGPNSERLLQMFKAEKPNYKCLPFGELAGRIVTAPIILPGNPEYDPV